MEKKKIGIIGGGISGAALGYYLSLYEEADITIFEKNRIGCGTTAKSAGTVCLFDDSLNNRYWDVRLYGFETYCKFEKEEKGSAGFDQTGTLVVALSEKEELRIKAGIALARAAGYSGEYITDKARIEEILPGINTENILGAGYTRDDGYFDGTMISNTFVKKMQANGGVVKTDTEVSEIIREGDAAVALKTADGTRYDFDTIVDCTGPWSRFTGELVGLDVPIWHTKAEAFFLCPPIKRPGYVFPVLKYPAFYALRAGENVFICKSHLSMNLDDPMHAGQWDPDKLPQTGGTDDYFIEFLFDQMDSYVPGLADSGLVSSWLSYRAEPRDFLPIIGETPVKNYLLATGYGENGVIEAPAVSRDLAKFIMRGESTLLLEEWAFNRLLKNKMKIAVLIKQVPASNDVAIDPVTHCLIRENAEMTVNPSDLNALTAAIELRRQCGGTITVFTMGPGEAKRALHTALAMGADEAFLVSDRCFGGGDTLGTARVLTAALNHTGTYDLVMAGDSSSDGATGQVGHMAAEMLGIPCAADARRIETNGASLLVLRQWKDRKVRVRIGLPCMITVGLGSNQIILPTIRSQMKANRRDIPVLTNAELGLDPEEIGKRGAKSLVTDTYARESSQRRAQMLTGSAAEIAAQIKALIEEASK